jgi:hypothetical protein
LCSKPNTEVSAVILKPTSRHESDRPKHISTTPAILSSGIVAAQITIIDVTKDGSHNSENSENTFVSPAEGSAAEHHAQQIPAEQEQLGMCDNSVQVNHKDDSLNSAGHSFAKQIVAEETEKNHLIIVNEGPDQLAVELEKSKDDMAIKAKAEDSITIISSSGNEETQVSATTGEHETYNQQKNISSLVSVGISLEDPAVESAKFEDVSTLKAEEDKSLAIKSPSTLSINQPSAETSAHQALGKQDIIAPPKLVAIPGPPLELCEAYNNLFLIFYSKFPVISTTSISIALKQCEALISIAKPLGTVSVIRPYLGNAIARFGKQLYMAIVAEPFRWLELSMILESAAIFKESMIHIVGTYIPGPEGPGGQINLPADIPQFVRDLIIYKVRQLDQQRMDVNERLFSSSIVIDSKTVTFSFVDTAVFSTWLVVQIWRDWFCRQIAGVHLNPQKTGQLYRILAKSGDAYLTTAAVKAVIEKIRDPVKVELDELREDLELLKKFAQEAVKELCVNNSMVDVQEAGIYYLTCTRTMDEELPWFETEQ